MRTRPRLLLVPLLLLVLIARPGQTASAGTERISLAVAARDLAAGELVTAADIAEVVVSKEWITETSVVTWDSREDIIERRLLLPMLKGDPFGWGLFGSMSHPSLREGCAQAARGPSTASEQVARARQRIIEGRKSTSPRQGK